MSLPAFAYTDFTGIIPNDLENTWATSDTYQPLADIIYDQIDPLAMVELTYSDNVGIFGLSWCTVSVYLDEALQPLVSGSYSGVDSISTFTNFVLYAKAVSSGSGLHTLHVRHKSQYCHYGNSIDELTPNRTFAVKFTYPAGAQ